MILIGGVSQTDFPPQVMGTGNYHLFLVDLITNQIHFKKTIINFRPFAATGLGDNTRLYFFGGFDMAAKAWSSSATYLNIS